MEKIIFTGIVGMILTASSYGQVPNDFFTGKSPQEIIAWQKQIGDKQFNEHIDAALKIGDKMPDLSLGTVTNNKTGKKSFADFKGKLVILDFWSTGCSACIAMFPKMEKLQRELGDKVQIFLVNARQDQAVINKQMKAMNKKMPDLPSIVGPREDLLRLFPVVYVPHHVWIDREGTIQVIGDYSNTYKDKILNLLNGKKVNSYNSSSNTPHFNDKIPYYQLMEKTIDPLMCNSNFYAINPFYVSGGASLIYKIDSFNNTKRSTYINQELYSLYYSFFQKDLNREHDRMLYSPGSYGDVSSYASLILNVKDTFRYTTNILNFKDRTDRQLIKSRLCYEQVVPAGWSDDSMKVRMHRDFDDYFRRLYGLKVSIESIDTTCYVLVRTSNVDKLSIRRASTSELVTKVKGTMVISSPSVRMLFNKFIYQYKTFPSNIFEDISTGKPLYFINETGFADYPIIKSDSRYEMALMDNGQIKTLSDLRLALKKYDLDIIKAKRKLKFMVMEDNMKDD